jgi:ribosomal protein S5
MSVTQTVEIPASHKLTIDVPREVPAGPAVIVLKPAAEPTGMTGKTVQEAMEAIERCSGLAVRLGINLSSDEFLEMRRQDKELEDRLDHLDQWQ